MFKTLKEAGTMGVSGDELRYLAHNKIDVEMFYRSICGQGGHVPDEVHMMDQGSSQSEVVVKRCREIMMKMIWKKCAKLKTIILIQSII